MRIQRRPEAATSIDNRAGCALLVELANHLKKNRPTVTVHIVGTVHEEFNLHRALRHAAR